MATNLVETSLTDQCSDIYVSVKVSSQYDPGACVASRRVASRRHILNKQIVMRRNAGQRDARRCKNRLEFYFCVACVASNQSDFSKKARESTKGVI